MARQLTRTIFNATATGTADFTVGSAVVGYMTPASAGVGNTGLYNYAAQTVNASGDVTAWEVGSGTYATATAVLTRTPLYSSTAANALIAFGTAPQVMVCTLASDFTPIVIDKGTGATGSTVTFSVLDSRKQKLTVGGALTVAYSNWAATGSYSEVEIYLVNGGVGVTWPTINWLKGDGTNATAFSSMGVTLQVSGTNFVSVWSIDGGTTIYGMAV